YYLAQYDGGQLYRIDYSPPGPGGAAFLGEVLASGLTSTTAKEGAGDNQTSLSTSARTAPAPVSLRESHPLDPSAVVPLFTTSTGEAAAAASLEWHHASQRSPGSAETLFTELFLGNGVAGESYLP